MMVSVYILKSIRSVQKLLLPHSLFVPTMVATLRVWENQVLLKHVYTLFTAESSLSFLDLFIAAHNLPSNSTGIQHGTWSFRYSQCPPADWGDIVLDSFLLHGILRDKNKQQEVLSVPHNSSQNHRLDQALAERNYCMTGTGQDMWAHACNKCMKIYQGQDGLWYRMTGGVHDGVTVRHAYRPSEREQNPKQNKYKGNAAAGGRKVKEEDREERGSDEGGEHDEGQQ
ncbi:hypothetical protein C8J57DRAFT_1480895 [Mycena rebaudengoi]|nr:hypothetical protein C8J57DRAFT_1480895 [Mycena rebaudengoi]